MWDKLKANRAFLFCVGMGAVLLLAKWLFTGSVFYAVTDLQREPAEGETAASVTTTALMPMIVDAAMAAFIAIGLWLLNIGEWIATKVYSAMQPVALRSDQPQDQASPSVVVGVQGLNQGMVLDLGRAALENDSEKIGELRNQIRKPKAIAELAEACNAGDLETADERMKELRSMLASAPATKAKRGGQQ